jgi:hypothetical protein
VAQRQNLFLASDRPAGTPILYDPQDHHGARMRALDLKRLRIANPGIITG